MVYCERSLYRTTRGEIALPENRPPFSVSVTLQFFVCTFAPCIVFCLVSLLQFSAYVVYMLPRFCVAGFIVLLVSPMLFTLPCNNSHYNIASYVA